MNRFFGKAAISILSESLQLPPNKDVSRRNNVSRAGLKTLLNFRRNGNRQWILITFHVYSRYPAATRDVHSTATGCKWLTFRITTMMQRNQSTHTARTDTASSNRKGKWKVSFVLRLLPTALQQNKASRLLYLLTSLIWYWKGAIHAWN